MAVGMTIVKRFSYLGDPTEEFANTYFFSGSTPADATAWRALFDALVTQEKTVLLDNTAIIRGYGYDSDAADRTAVWSVDLRVSPEVTVGGTLATTGKDVMPGDTAVWLRWKTSRVTMKGKPIYLRKYYHPGLRAASPTSPDTVDPAQVTALNALGTKLMDGTFLSSRKLVGPGHTDDVLTSRSCSPYFTTRTLKRRGKRPGA